jgi:DNA-binding transcriptional MerR regulator
MQKSRDAFRTISEVAEWLDTPAHVLRFWESKFSQIKPLKRAGGRRYYRPEDMELLSGIKYLLHEQGMTIKGAQKLLRENGIKHVSALGRTLNDTAELTATEEPITPSPKLPPEVILTQPDEITPDLRNVPTSTEEPAPSTPPADNVVALDSLTKNELGAVENIGDTQTDIEWQNRGRKLLKAEDFTGAEQFATDRSGTLSFLSNQSRRRLEIRKDKIRPLYQQLQAIRQRITESL